MPGVGERGNGAIAEIPTVRIRTDASGNDGRELGHRCGRQRERRCGNRDREGFLAVGDFGIRHGITGSRTDPEFYDPPSGRKGFSGYALPFGGKRGAGAVGRYEFPRVRGAFCRRNAVKIVFGGSGGVCVPYRGHARVGRREHPNARRSSERPAGIIRGRLGIRDGGRRKGDGERITAESNRTHPLRVAHVERVDDRGHLYEFALGNVFVRAERTVGSRRKDADVRTLLGIAEPIRVDVLEGPLALEVR